ncbi:MAG: LD-carboxypeptidase [Lachnospira sp.]|nr:LD-carboxypeptidase [Lachnospira sp.]
MRFPKFLKKNGTIGFVAPSFGCATEPYLTGFKSAQEKFKALGYNCKLGDNCYKAEGVGISNKPELCGKELMDMYMDGESDVIISCGGGELMCETISHVDFDVLAEAEPKWYMGYSDNTNFTFLQTTICDTAAIYGSCAATFGMDEWHPALEDAMGLLTGEKLSLKSYDGWEKESLKSEENPTAPWNITEPRVLKVYKDGILTDCSESVVETGFKGRLVGGCMDCLVNLTGTKYDKVKEFNARYKEDGIIWFLESCDLNVFAIRRAMWQMENAGWFDNVKGFIIGRPLVFGQDMMGLDQYSAVLSVAAKYNVPVIMDCDLGHLAPTMPLISGAMAEVVLKDNDLNVNMILE